MEQDNPQVLSVVQSEVEAWLIVNHLADNGIKARAVGANLGALWPELPREVQVVVRQADISRSKELLNSLPPRDEQAPATMTAPKREWLRLVALLMLIMIFILRTG
jgi:hypothetical protein